MKYSFLFSSDLMLKSSYLDHIFEEPWINLRTSNGICVYFMPLYNGITKQATTFSKLIADPMKQHLKPI